MLRFGPIGRLPIYLGKMAGCAYRQTILIGLPNGDGHPQRIKAVAQSGAM